MSILNGPLLENHVDSPNKPRMWCSTQTFFANTLAWGKCILTVSTISVGIADTSVVEHWIHNPENLQ